MILTTERLLLRQFEGSEVQMLWAMNSDERVARYIPQRTEQETHELFAQMLADYHANPKLGRWAIFEQQSNEFAGMCMLINARHSLQGYEIGYSLNYSYWGKGMATEIVQAVVDYGLNVLGLTEIYAITVAENVASGRVLKKAGFNVTEITLNGEPVLYHRIRKAL
ncbi:MAG TPA: GNAT family N-acetyltransferase [Mucilaginibacter sp.]